MYMDKNSQELLYFNFGQVFVLDWLVLTVFSCWWLYGEGNTFDILLHASLFVSHLETVNLNLILLGETQFNKEIPHSFTLVTLELDDLPVLRVSHHCPIACKFLLAALGYLLFVIII